MTLKDISNGPATAILWIVFSLLLDKSFEKWCII